MHAARLHALQGVDFLDALCMCFFPQNGANSCQFLLFDPSSPVNT
jgi:hypothetical protein